MAGLQNSNNKNKHFTDSSNTNPALTTASTTHYSKPPTTPTSPALSTSNTTTKSPDNISSSESPRNNNKSSTVSNTTTTTTTNTSNSNNNNSSSSSNSNSPAGPRSLVPTTTHSAFSPYSQHPTSVPQHPTPVTTPTNTTITTKNSQPNSSSSSPSLSNTTMMSASHLDNSGSTLIYPQHAHFTNPTTHSFWPWGFSGGNPAGTAANGTTLLPTTGGSAFVPAVGYGAGSNMAPTHNPRPKLTTTIWEDEGTLCYQVDARGICVARRQDNDMINGTKLLNVVGMSRGKRDGILKNEKGRVVVKVGAMHLKGVWITFARAKSLAAQFKISELLYPLFVDDPSIFLHNSYGQSMSTRIPSLNNAPTSQWRPAHHYPNNFNNAPYTPETTRQWYPYGNSNPLMGSPNGPHGQDHGSPYPPAAGGYSERPQNANPPAVPMYSAQPPRNHNAHPQAHLEEYDTGYNLINGQSQGQQGVAVVQGPGVSSYNLSTDYKNGPTAAGYYSIPQNSTGGYLGQQQQQQQRPPSSYEPSNIQRNTNPSSSSSSTTTSISNNSSTSYTPVKTEENNSSNGNGYMRSNGQGLYNLVSATDVVGGSPAQNNSQLIGQKRGYVGDDENDDYNNVNNSSQPSPPLAMHPPPPISGIAVSGAMNVAAGSFPSPMNVSPNSPPGNSAFSGWNPNGKRVKYEFPESTTPPSAPSPRFQLPGLGAGPATPGANPSTPQAYTSSNLQMVTNAQSSPHYSNATNANTTTTNGGPATGTTTPTTEGLDRFFDQGTVLQTPSPENVGNTPTEESNRRYEYRTRDTSEEINHGGWD